jgi:hypothetical protein
MPKWISPTLVLALAFVPVAAAHASDGVIEISQACVATGCVPGDTPGFPVTLSAAGSYRLTSNLSPSTAQVGIDVTANDVAIDLGGFTIGSTNSCSGPPSVASTCTVNDNAADGIHSVGLRTRVRDGAVVGMGGSGLQLDAQAEVDHVEVANNGDRGIQISSGQVTDSSAFDNFYFGIYVLSGPGLVERSVAATNGFTGILVTNGEIAHSQSTDNASAGLVIQGSGSLAIGNLVLGNVGFGISAVAGSGYAQNVINNNHGGNANAQVASGNNLGGNVCGTDTTCP